ncbi:sensor histidine kinase [Kineococcus radiotolerans]|uniref:histidine kinase n=1 Tax=Kineococcus radiotolerans (strain ATCC BAA-149 / DSM 14245 / SRS30216) TaxID=266940 RepID=A6W904_KINRD|nr:HAMP domain-containing sensor histidine kinase [Kineococcus radiotolerans]ABS03293.1 integral membrane sensor signal transduction histidine kinase [Kineococcus radiotolerans SRS30216 = ATCC BAA-149]
MWRRAGVRVRSTVAATALLAVLVAAGAVTGLLVLRSALYGGAAETGSVQARLVRLSVTEEVLAQGPAGAEGTGDPLPAREALDAAVGARVDRGSHVQVLDASGAVVARSARLAGLAALSPARPPSAGQVQEVVALPQLGGRSRWVVTVVGAEVGDRPFYVVVAESTEDADRVLLVAAGLLAVGSPLLLAAIAVATWTFVGRSLRPVEAIRRTVEGITARGLDGRVPVPVAEDEVSRLARTINEVLARLELAQRGQRRFVADASHELRSPVATLRAAAEVWAGAGVPAPFTALVQAESARLEALVSDLLALARADEGRAVRQWQEVDLDEVVESEAARLRAVAGCAVVVTTTPARVRGDAVALARAVRNLSDNAVRHADSAVRLELSVRDGEALLRVCDDGPGIPVGERERVFERFVRLDESRQRGSGGTGLGLPIVRETVAAHGGTVQVEDSPGRGAVLALRVPLAPPDAPPDAPPADRAGGQPPSAASR